ncbi:hypothetical protein GQX74_013151 [Glossina fuscipes]|nr:hypothetical protein GQX74_013151 [Glossina fuscipes]
MENLLRYFPSGVVYQDDMTTGGKNLGKGKGTIELIDGRHLLVRDNRNANKSHRRKQQLGHRSYCCILGDNNKEMKRHINQVFSKTNQQLNSSLENVQSLLFRTTAMPALTTDTTTTRDQLLSLRQQLTLT